MANNNLPPTWRFDFGDYQSLGPTFQKFLANLNLFTLAIYNLMNGGIGISNMQRSFYSTTVTGGSSTTALSFVNPLPIPPSGVSLIQVTVNPSMTTAITSAVCVSNFYYDGKNINILNITGLTTGVVYNIVLEVM